MPRERVLNFYLNDGQRAKLDAGDEGMNARVIAAVRAAGWACEVHGLDRAVGGDGYHLVFNRAVEVPFCLNLRRCLTDPFYRIEASNDRWDWDVARRPFHPSPASRFATEFQQRWRDRLFKTHPIGTGGYVFMPLQGKLRERRHFQAMSPVKMIEATLRAEPDSKIIATLHPKEVYAPGDLAALNRFDARFQLSTESSIGLLAGCDYVVTQNSTMALTGFFADKPAVLFARIDFHHGAANVVDLGVDAAFAQVQDAKPAFASYLHWFFKKQAITAWDKDAEDRIRERFRNLGWPM